MKTARAFVAALGVMALLVGGFLTQRVVRADASFAPYLVRAAAPTALVPAHEGSTALADEARARERAELEATLTALVGRGLARAPAFDLALDGHRVDLTSSARDLLRADERVASVEALSESAATSSAAAATSRSAQSVSSVVFVQVHSPFVWGRTSVGGLSVELTLEDSAGAVRGVTHQTYQPAPNNFVKVDRTDLYFETTFVDPNDPAHPYVVIRPGDRVRVVTTGQDPNTGLNQTDDRRIVVDDLSAHTSYEQDTVFGTAPPGSKLTVTLASSLNFTQYLAPVAGVSYAELTAGADGRFVVREFRMNETSTPARADLKQGSTGFVRLQHSDGNEVYTVHGQNVLVLETSPVVHGYAFPIATAGKTMEAGVLMFPRPTPPVGVVVKTGIGTTKATAGTVGSLMPWAVKLPASIAAGDAVEVSLWGQVAARVNVPGITTDVDFAGNRLTGTGPANTTLVAGAARVGGYLTSYTPVTYLEQRVTTGSGGAYASAQFDCGTNTNLSLRPGSFGYVGFEDNSGNFVYRAWGVPINQAMSDYPFVEGFSAQGDVRPSVMLRDPAGTVKHSGSGEPLLLYFIQQRLYVNTYYQARLTAYPEPGDSMTISSTGGTYSIPIVKFTAFSDTDGEAVVGEAPAGSTVRAIPYSDRFARRVVSAEASGAYRAATPFTTLRFGSCAEEPKTIDFKPGDHGRAYLQLSNATELFTSIGRSLNITLNEPYVDIYQFPVRDLDWDPRTNDQPGRRKVTLTLTPRGGGTATIVEATTDGGLPGKTRLELKDGQNQRVLIRAGDTVSASFEEGPPTLLRRVTLSVTGLPLVLGVPDVDTSTVGGVGPRGWTGQTTLGIVPEPSPVGVTTSDSTAFAPVQFVDRTKKAVALLRGHSGTVSFTNTTGGRVWGAWAVAAIPTKIAGWLNAGDTRVCGTAAPDTVARIHDLTSETEDIVLGSGTVGADGKFCVDVPPLFKGQVVAAEANGVYSLPVVIGQTMRVYIGYAPRVITGLQ